jgi:GTP-sensing pleiotropic transcriptional regulator CodY
MKFPMDDECHHNKQFVFVKNYNDHFEFVRTYVRCGILRCLKSVVKILFEQNCITSNISSETVGVEIEQKQPGNQTVKSENEAVINLFTRILSDSETKLFTKGLKFVPTRRNIDLGRLLTDLKEWERRRNIFIMKK